MNNNAQNPYGSYAVAASAGAGKTYQLTQRYLKLVAAGAEPATILTITFTRKAAAEMRERILQEALKLGQNSAAAENFNQEVATFFEEYQNSQEFSVKPPRAAKEVSQIVLAASQAMRISTIDSAFWEWFRKFPWETTGDPRGDANPSLCDESQGRELDEQAWQRFVKEKLTNHAPTEFDFLSQRGIYGLQDRITELNNYTTYAWLKARVRRDGSALNMHPLAEGDLCEDEAALIGQLVPALNTLAADANANVAEAVRLAISEKTLTKLYSSGFLTKTLGVSKTFFRDKKRAKYENEISTIEEKIKNFENHRRLAKLNGWGSLLFEFYDAYLLVRDQIKQERGLVEFGDLAKGAFQLFNSEDAAGARYLIHRNTKHVLIDEFQDTSRLQWAIFAKLAEEILSGESLATQSGEAPPSMFIVGDDKQSVYGFREADPTILGEAAATFAPFGLKNICLSENFRSAPLILDFANELFKDLLPNFPTHMPVCDSDGQSMIGDHALIAKAPLFIPEAHEGLAKAREAEAEFVAKFLKQALTSHNPRWQVFDKALKAYRPLMPKDCALLFRFSTHAEVYEAALRKAGLACVRDQAGGFFNRPEIADLLALLRFLAYPVDLLSLATVLKSPMTSLEDEDLVALLQLSLSGEKTSGPRRLKRIFELLETKNPATYQTLQSLCQASRYEKPTQMLLSAIKGFSIFERYQASCSEEEALLAKANILQFAELLVNMERQGHASLHKVCVQLEKLKENEILGNASMQSNAITLMTIHKAKGLEFPFLALVDSAKPWEKRDRYWAKGEHPSSGDGLYYIGTSPDRPVEEACFEQILSSADSASRAENIRLLYVALTRAKQFLLVSGYQEKKDESQESFYGYMAKALEGLGAKSKEGSLEEKSYLYLERSLDLTTKAMTLTGSSSESTPLALSELYPEFIEASEFKPTQIKTIRAKTDKVKKTPTVKASGSRPPAVARAIGVLVHAALEAHIKKEAFNGEQIWAQVYLEEPSLAASYKEQILREAATCVGNLLASSIWSELVGGAIRLEAEVPLIHLLDDQMFSGRIDLLIEANGGDLVLVDYKTSQDEDDEAYKEQLQSYAAAIKHMNPKAKVSGKVLYTNSLTLKELFIY